ncbi:hypothetical protein C8R43DRAFT_1009930 [Mycena crocata]|nr:hypothetical protein C8R43DRAFT_1009930 [Mycena crocata]
MMGRRRAARPRSRGRRRSTERTRGSIPVTSRDMKGTTRKRAGRRSAACEFSSHSVLASTRSARRKTSKMIRPRRRSRTNVPAASARRSRMWVCMVKGWSTRRCIPRWCSCMGTRYMRLSRWCRDKRAGSVRAGWGIPAPRSLSPPPPSRARRRGWRAPSVGQVGGAVSLFGGGR